MMTMHGTITLHTIHTGVRERSLKRNLEFHFHDDFRALEGKAKSWVEKWQGLSEEQVCIIYLFIILYYSYILMFCSFINYMCEKMCAIHTYIIYNNI